MRARWRELPTTASLHSCSCSPYPRDKPPGAQVARVSIHERVHSCQFWCRRRGHASRKEPLYLVVQYISSGTLRDLLYGAQHSSLRVDEGCLPLETPVLDLVDLFSAYSGATVGVTLNTLSIYLTYQRAAAATASRATPVRVHRSIILLSLSPPLSSVGPTENQVESRSCQPVPVPVPVQLYT